MTSFVVHTSNARLLSDKYQKILFGIDERTALEIQGYGGTVVQRQSDLYGTSYSVAVRIAVDGLCARANTLKRSELVPRTLYDMVLMGKPYTFEEKSGITLEGYVTLTKVPELDSRVAAFLLAEDPVPKRQRFTTSSAVVVPSANQAR